MLGWLKRLLFGSSLDSALHSTRKLRVGGVRFTIQKINVMNYVDGSKVLRQTFELYRSGKPEAVETNWDKLKPYYVDILMAGVVYPKLARKPDDEGFPVESMFNNMDMVHQLVDAIYEHTYGKKKFKQLVSQGQRLLRSTS